jgi:hypothetical protein
MMASALPGDSHQATALVVTDGEHPTGVLTVRSCRSPIPHGRELCRSLGRTAQISPIWAAAVCVRWRHPGVTERRGLPTARGFRHAAWQAAGGHHLGYEHKGAGMQDAGLFTGRDPLGATAAPLRHVPPDALSMSALSAHVAGGAHAIGQPTGQAWSSPFPTFPGFNGGAIASQTRHSACCSPACDARRHQRAGTSGFQAYARGTTLTVSPTRQNTFCAPILARVTGQAGRAKLAKRPGGCHQPYGSFTRFRAASPPLSLIYADLAMLREKDHRDEQNQLFSSAPRLRIRPRSSAVRPVRHAYRIHGIAARLWCRHGLAPRGSGISGGRVMAPVPRGPGSICQLSSVPPAGAATAQPSAYHRRRR